MDFWAIATSRLLKINEDINNIEKDIFKDVIKNIFLSSGKNLIGKQ
jgi:hypothetical protein